MVIVGSSGCEKNVLVMKMLLTDGFLDYNNLLFYSTTINQFELQLLRHGFSRGLSKSNFALIFSKQSIVPEDLETAPEIIGWFINKKFVVPLTKKPNNHHVETYFH